MCSCTLIRNLFHAHVKTMSLYLNLVENRHCIGALKVHSDRCET